MPTYIFPIHRCILRALPFLIAPLILFTAPVARADTLPANTPIHESATQVAGLLFVAGDVGRLSDVPSGTESVVLERVLQQLYRDEPALDPGQAVTDIQALEATLASGSQAISPSTLTVMGGNQRILAILRALTDSSPPADVAHAIAQVDNDALTEASQSAQALGTPFDASVDALDTLSFGSFSPAATLNATVSLAAADRSFGQARDQLWQSVSHESVFDSTSTLLGENPALQNAAVQAFVGTLNADGSLDTTAGRLETLVTQGVTTIGNQSCQLAPGTTGASPGDCASGSLHDAQVIHQACASTNDPSAGCTSARQNLATDSANELAVINAEDAVVTAEAEAFNGINANFSQAEAGEAQAASALADQVNSYNYYHGVQKLEKAGFDTLGLFATLATATINPTSLVSGLFNVVTDGLGLAGFNGPDPNAVILQGLQNISQQLSDFESYTQSAFSLLDTQLSSLSGQVSQEAYQLSAQLSHASLQITQLTSSVTALQSSVDHLQSEVQSLFAQGARNDLSTLINQYLGYRQANGVALPQAQFAQAAGAFFQDATSTALTQTVLNVPTGFDALTAESLVTPSDPLSLDANINLFNAFPSLVSDSPFTWPGALTTTCAQNADIAHDLCLPDPDFWSTSARAFSQLLTENPQYVTATRVSQLSTIMQEGELISNALRQLSINDAGVDSDEFSGNRTLDAAIRYYENWGDQLYAHPDGTPPALTQALDSEASSYLGSLNVPGEGITDRGVNPWGSATSPPDLQTLQNATSFTNVPLCSSEASFIGVSPTSKALPSIPAADLAVLPAPVANAVRLGIGRVTACWGGSALDEQPGGGGPDGLTGRIQADILYYYDSPDGSIHQEVAQSFGITPSGTSDCTNDGDANTLAEGVDNVWDGWPGTAGPHQGCPDLSKVLVDSPQNITFAATDAVNYVTPLVAVKLASLRQGVYNDILSNGSTLTSGSGDATNVQAAALRLQGAAALLNGYVSLGLPQALAGDDTLRTLITGVGADPLDTVDTPNADAHGLQVPYESSVPAQVVAVYKAAEQTDPASDPAATIGTLIADRGSALFAALRAHIVPMPPPALHTQGPARAQPADATSADTSSADGLAEDNPVVAPTLDRLDETIAVLQDELGSGSTSSQSTTTATGGPGTGGGTATTTPPTSTTSTTSTSTTSAPAPAGSQPAPANPPKGTVVVARHARAACVLTVSGNPVVVATTLRRDARGRKPGALAVTARCDQAARVTLTGVLATAARGPKAHVTDTRLPRQMATVKPGVAETFAVHLPASAVAAVQRRVHVAATFTLTAVNANGTVTVTAHVGALTPLR
jgi:hypothetical protein